jgi:hypothetical protein
MGHHGAAASSSRQGGEPWDSLAAESKAGGIFRLPQGHPDFENSRFGFFAPPEEQYTP